MKEPWLIYEIYGDYMAVFAEKSLNLPITMPPTKTWFGRPA